MKKKQRILILIVSIILGIIIASQYKVVQQNYLKGISPIKRYQELSNSYTSIVNERDNLERQIDEYESQIKAIEDSMSKENTLVRKLTSDLEKYKMVGGFVDVTGPGIEIIIDNPPSDIIMNYDINLVYDYQLINSLVNELNAAGAEAISINDERIIATSEIRNAGSNISINTVQYKPPLIVKAIGDKDTLHGALDQVFGIANEFHDRGYYFEIKKTDSVLIGKFNGIVDFKYMKVKE
jgi:uncharacterized protein YlxW (UPF0749 family)